MMVNFRTVRWKNLLASGNSWTEVVLDKTATTLLSGKNGRGKSTFIEAVHFGLFGKPFRNINKDQLVNSINGKNTLVEIEFEVGTTRYLVRRGIKPNVFEIYADGVLVDQTAAVKDYQEYLEADILRFGAKSFRQIVVLGNKNYVPFMQLPAGNRRDFVEDLLDAKVFGTMAVNLKEKVKANKADLEEVRRDLELTLEKVQLNRAQLEQLRKGVDEEVAVKRARMSELETAIGNEEAQISKLQEQVLGLRAKTVRKESLHAKWREIEEVVKIVDRRKYTLGTKVEFFRTHDVCNECSRPIEDHFKADRLLHFGKKLEKVSMDLTEVEAARADVVQQIAEIEAVEREISTLERHLLLRTTTARGFDREVKTLNQEIERLLARSGEDGELPKRIAELKEQAKAKNARREELLREQETLQICQLLLKDDGIKGSIVKKYVPVINKLVNGYLKEMDAFYGFNLNEKFEETITSRHRDKFSFESFSAGEQDRINLAILFTWRAVSKLRSRASTNLLIFDETFDSSLDSEGSEDFMRILKSLTKGTHVFVISHREGSHKDMFDRTLHFDKVKDFSVMVEEEERDMP